MLHLVGNAAVRNSNSDRCGVRYGAAGSGVLKRHFVSKSICRCKGIYAVSICGSQHTNYFVILQNLIATSGLYQRIAFLRRNAQAFAGMNRCLTLNSHVIGIVSHQVYINACIIGKVHRGTVVCCIDFDCSLFLRQDRSEHAAAIGVVSAKDINDIFGRRRAVRIFISLITFVDFRADIIRPDLTIPAIYYFHVST